MTKTSIDADAIRQLASLLDETGLNELEYDSGSFRVRLSRGATVVHAAAPVAGPAAPAAAAAVPASPADHPGAVKAPMVGVTYNAPEPGAAPFIQPGQMVTEGQTIMLIEAMKTFNPVRAPRSGKVTAILVTDGQPVEYGEPLAIIE